MKLCGNKTNKNSNFFVERTSVVTLDFSRRGAVCIFFYNNGWEVVLQEEVKFWKDSKSEEQCKGSYFYS